MAKVFRRSSWSAGSGVTAVVLTMLVGMGRASADQEVAAGEIVHVLHEQRVLAALPADMAQGTMKGKVSAKAPKAGMVWYVLRGTTTNRSAKQAIFGYGTIWVMAGADKISPASASAFQPAETSVIRSVRLAPGASAPWVAFFQVPEGATGVALHVTNLDQLPRTRIVKTLPLADARPGGGTAPAVSAVSAPSAAARMATPLTIPLTRGPLSLVAQPGATSERTSDGAIAATGPVF